MFNILLSVKKAAIYLVVLLLAFFPIMLAGSPVRTYAAAAEGEEVVATEPETVIAAAEEVPAKVAAQVSESSVTDFPDIDQLEIPEIANAKIDAREHMIAKRNDLDQEWLKLKMEEKAAAQAAAAEKAKTEAASSGRSWSAGADLGRFKLTAYCPCYECSEGWGRMTSSGRTAQPNHTIATDPRVIPEGTRVIINGEVYVAEDQGGGVKGNHIDIFFESHAVTEDFGVQYAEVYIAD